MSLAYEHAYKQIRMLGQGAYGRCFLVRNTVQNKHYVAKKLSLDNSTSKKEDIHKEVSQSINNCVPYKSDAADRLALHRQVQGKLPTFRRSRHHHGILPAYSTNSLSQQYFTDGDLRGAINKAKQEKRIIKEAVVKKWFMQLCFGLEYLHKHKIMHRDLKPENIFLGTDGTIKIGDFGTSKFVNSTSALSRTIVGTYLYMRYLILLSFIRSPEIINEQAYSYEADLWSLGCILFEVCNLVFPFPCRTLAELIYHVKVCEPRDFSEEYSTEMVNVVSMLLKLRSERASLKQVMESGLFVGALQEQYLNKMAAETDRNEEGGPIYAKIMTKKKIEEISEEIIVTDRQENENKNKLGVPKLGETVQSISNWAIDEKENLQKSHKPKHEAIQTQCATEQAQGSQQRGRILCFSATFEDIQLMDASFSSGLRARN